MLLQTIVPNYTRNLTQLCLRRFILIFSLQKPGNFGTEISEIPCPNTATSFST